MKVLHIGEEVAIIGEPLLAASPYAMFLPLVSSTLSFAGVAEATIGGASGTGAQKLSQVTAGLIPQAQAWAKSVGIEHWPEAEIEKWASAFVDAVKLVPQPTTKA